LREERRLRVVENRVLRRVFGPKRDVVSGEWRKLHNEELNYLYCSPNSIRVIKSGRMRWVGHVALWGRSDVHTRFWWENLKEINHLEGRWEDNIKMDLQEFGCEGKDWIDLAQNRERWQAFVNAVMNLRIL
jgi:hypothetical protein